MKLAIVICVFLLRIINSSRHRGKRQKHRLKNTNDNLDSSGLIEKMLDRKSELIKKIDDQYKEKSITNKE